MEVHEWQNNWVSKNLINAVNELRALWNRYSYMQNPDFLLFFGFFLKNKFLRLWEDVFVFSKKDFSRTRPHPASITLTSSQLKHKMKNWSTRCFSFRSNLTNVKHIRLNFTIKLQRLEGGTPNWTNNSSYVDKYKQQWIDNSLFSDTTSNISIEVPSNVLSKCV